MPIYRIIIFAGMAVVSAALGVYSLINIRQASVIVEWSTASELNTAGFNLFRSERPDGEYIRVNHFIIPASGDSFTGSDYSFEDRGLINGQRYYYLLEDIDQNGKAQRNGPIEVLAGNSCELELAMSGLAFTIAVTGLYWSLNKSKPNGKE